VYATFSDSLFASPRLCVRPYAPGDAAAHRALRADADVQRFMHWPDEEDFAALLRDSAGRTPPDDRGWINLAVADRTGTVIGDHGLNVAEDVASLGLALLPQVRRAGLGRELLAASMVWLKRHGVRRFRAEIDFGNAASFALFFSMGFRLVADREDQFGPFSVLEHG
jgi:RimJ/RimL family protein N-acetyltransferase